MKGKKVYASCECYVFAVETGCRHIAAVLLSNDLLRGALETIRGKPIDNEKG